MIYLSDQAVKVVRATCQIEWKILGCTTMIGLVGLGESDRVTWSPELHGQNNQAALPKPLAPARNPIGKGKVTLLQRGGVDYLHAFQQSLSKEKAEYYYSSYFFNCFDAFFTNCPNLRSFLLLSSSVIW